jgi:hypothetical protein
MHPPHNTNPTLWLSRRNSIHSLQLPYDMPTPRVWYHHAGGVSPVRNIGFSYVNQDSHCHFRRFREF